MAGSCLATVAAQQCVSLGGKAHFRIGQKEECRLSIHAFVTSSGRRCEGRSIGFGAGRYLSKSSSQRHRVSCSLGSSDDSTASERLKRTQDSLLRMAVVPLLASAIIVGAAAPSQAESMGIDWNSLMEAPETKEAESSTLVAEEAEAPSYKDLLQKFKTTVAPPQAEEAAPEAAPAPAAPAPPSLLERQQKRLAELAEKAAKQAAEREAAAQAYREKREAEAARKAAERQAAEEAKAAALAVKREAEQSALAAKREAEESARAAAQEKAAAEKATAEVATKAKTEAKTATGAPVSVGKKATHGFMPLFVAQLLFFFAYAGGIYVIFFVPEEQLSQVKKPLEELVEKAMPLVEQARPAVVSALEKGQELAAAAMPAVGKAIETAKPLAAQAWEASKPVAAKAVEASKPLVKQAQEKAKELVNQAKEQVSKSG